MTSSERTDFSPFIEKMNKNQSIWMIGYPEQSRGAIGCAVDSARALEVDCKQVKDSWRGLIGNGMGIFRPITPLTRAWMDLVHRRLDEVLLLLKEHPAPCARCCFGHMGGYSLSWNELKGGTLHPLQFQYDMAASGRSLAELPLIDTSGYRSSSEETLQNS